MSAPRRVRAWLQRKPWEIGSMLLIGLGLAMMMQPWSMALFGHSFVVLLAGVAGYTVAGKLPKE